MDLVARVRLYWHKARNCSSTSVFILAKGCEKRPPANKQSHQSSYKPEKVTHLNQHPKAEPARIPRVWLQEDLKGDVGQA